MDKIEEFVTSHCYSELDGRGRSSGRGFIDGYGNAYCKGYGKGFGNDFGDESGDGAGNYYDNKNFGDGKGFVFNNH